MMYLNVLRISYDNEWKVHEEDDKDRRVPQFINCTYSDQDTVSAVPVSEVNSV